MNIVGCNLLDFLHIQREVPHYYKAKRQRGLEEIRGPNVVKLKGDKEHSFFILRALICLNFYTMILIYYIEDESLILKRRTLNKYNIN